MVPSLLIALRLARLNMGMTLNGMLYARLMMTQDFVPKATTSSIVTASRVNRSACRSSCSCCPTSSPPSPCPARHGP
jgi:hypothetical protein